MLLIYLLSTYPSTYPSIHLTAHPFIHPFIYLFIISLSHLASISQVLTAILISPSTTNNHMNVFDGILLFSCVLIFVYIC